MLSTDRCGLIDLWDLTAAQTSLFCCTGANLTVRNCTITLINPVNQPFTLVRAEGTATRGSRVRLEKTLIRGAVSSGFDLGKGSVDVAVRETIFLGSQGPFVRGLDPERRGDQRFSVVGGVLAGRGPGFELKGAPGGDAQRKPAPLVVRAFDTVFGRFQGAGIASILFSESPAASPRDRVDWLGQQNLFCGWKGYYASGAEQTLRVPSLAAFRSTWNGTDQNSREILASWPQPQHLSQAVPADLGPFVPGREPALAQAAAPRPFLGAKTLWTFPPPSVPVSVGLTGKGAPGAPGPLSAPTAPLRRISIDGRDPALGPPKAAVDSLIHVEDGDLILHRCQFVAPAGTEARTPRLVAFFAPSTRPRSTISHGGLFASEPDRPVCIILESTLTGRRPPALVPREIGSSCRGGISVPTTGGAWPILNGSHLPPCPAAS